MSRALDMANDPPWLATFGQLAGIKDAEELKRLHSLARLLRSPQEAKPHRPRPSMPTPELRQSPADQKPGFNLQDAYAAQTDHMAMIACSLGACPECWGHDPDCTQCVGEGRPGAFLPDERCFERFVLPVIQRILRDQKSPALDQRGISRTERHQAENRSQS